MTIKRIHREISDLKREEMGGMTLGPTEQSLFNWRGSMPGPPGSCYEGGLFWMEITLPPDYPYVFITIMYFMRRYSCVRLTQCRFSAPKVMFTTRYESFPGCCVLIYDESIRSIYHMNISER